MFADIASGHTSGADVCFLIAVVLAGLAALVSIPKLPNAGSPWATTLGWAAVALVALAWLLL